MTEIKPGTPLPWVVTCRNDRSLVYQANADPMKVLSVAEVHSGKTLATDNQAVAAANAAYIVAACNAYPSVITGLREAREALGPFERLARAVEARNAKDGLGGLAADSNVHRLTTDDYRRAIATLAHLDTLLANQEDG